MQYTYTDRCAVNRPTSSASFFDKNVLFRLQLTAKRLKIGFVLRDDTLDYINELFKRLSRRYP